MASIVMVYTVMAYSHGLYSHGAQACAVVIDSAHDVAGCHPCRIPALVGCHLHSGCIPVPSLVVLMAYILMACVVMAYIIMPHTVMAPPVYRRPMNFVELSTYIIMAYVLMAFGHLHSGCILVTSPCCSWACLHHLIKGPCWISRPIAL